MVKKTPEEEYTETRRARIILRAKLNDVPLLTIITAVMVVVLVYLTGKVLYRLRDILLLMVVGSFIALLLNPLVDGLERWKIKRRGYAVAIVALGTVIIFAALAFAFGDPLVNSLTHLSHTLPSYVDRAEQGKGWLGKLLRHYHVDNWIHKNSSKLVSLARGLSKPALALGKGAVTVLFALVTMFAFVMILLLEATKIREAIIAMIAPQHAERVRRISSAISKAALGYMLANLVISAVAAVAVLRVALRPVGPPGRLPADDWRGLGGISHGSLRRYPLLVRRHRDVGRLSCRDAPAEPRPVPGDHEQDGETQSPGRLRRHPGGSRTWIMGIRNLRRPRRRLARRAHRRDHPGHREGVLELVSQHHESGAKRARTPRRAPPKSSSNSLPP